MDCTFLSRLDFDEENVDTYVLSLSFQNLTVKTDPDNVKVKNEKKEKKAWIDKARR